MPRSPALIVGLTVALAVAGCSSPDSEGKLQWVAGLRPGDCVDAGNRARPEVVRMRVVRCDRPHSMEVYARLPYRATGPMPSPTPSSSAPPTVAPLVTSTPPAAPSSSTEYPGRDVLRAFAREACAEHFRAYLGTNPREPWYFLTYLFPSVGSWTAASKQRPHLGPLARLVTSSARSDRSVVCFLRTTGPALTASVRGRSTTPEPASEDQ